MATAWPKVAQGLATLLPTLPGFADAEVYDGPPVTESRPLRYVTVGYVDDAEAGSYSTEPSPVDGATTESGEVRCRFVSQSGDDLSANRSAVFALVDALETALATDQTLGGVLSADGTAVLSVAVDSVINARGSAQSVVVTLIYQTRRS